LHALPETYITKETKMARVIVQTTKGRLVKRYEPITGVYEIIKKKLLYKIQYFCVNLDREAYSQGNLCSFLATTFFYTLVMQIYILRKWLLIKEAERIIFKRDIHTTEASHRQSCGC